MKRFFQFEALGTSYRSEILGGVTTFFAMAYIVVVNPAILAEAGVPREASTTATIAAAIVGTLLMALWARRPFGIAPYMGENAFVAYTVCLAMGYTWQQALGAVFLSGVVFIIVTALRIRSWIIEALPAALKASFAAGIGFFIVFVGLNHAGLVQVAVPGAPVKIGDWSSPPALLSLLCIVLIAVLQLRRVPAAILVGMLATALLGFGLGVDPWPQHWFSPPPSLEPLALKLDIRGALSPEFFPIVMVLFIMAFVDTMGTLIGVSMRAGLLDRDGNLPDIEKPLMADAVATTCASLFGTTTTGAYIESAAGIESGARSGFASLVTALLFVLCLFAAPILVAVPASAVGAALVVVGFLMLGALRQLPAEDWSEWFPAAATMVLMAFTFNIGFGMAAGFVLYPTLKVASGRARELKPGIWVLFALSLLLFVLYPYQRAR
jgi:AGZA family xanthine/uracil permease-like MFS transporter